MAEEASKSGTSSRQSTRDESSESTIEINIKTLDSKIYTFCVNKNMAVSKLKEKLIEVSGVPVERQRLIFRGKVLKDDHLLSEYHLEDGHTLHLVARQPVEGQPSSGTGSDVSRQNNNNQGGDVTSGLSGNNRIGVSQSVLLGTVNVADQGDVMMADIGSLVGAVLNSLGLGNGAPAGMVSATPPATAATPNTDAGRTQNAAGNRTSHIFSQHTSTGFPFRHVVIQDSLATLSEFISRMERVLQNGSSESSSTTNQHDPPQTESSSFVTRGLPTSAMLRAVVEQAQQLLRGNAADALARVASRLEREGASTDTSLRLQIQAEATHVGAAMQHLGSMLLELGRTMMLLRMGETPVDFAVNAGPAVYISSAGPNPIMVQPFPPQTNSLFGVSPSHLVGGISGSSPAGDPSRNINISIHAGNHFIPGTSTVPRSSSGEATHADNSNSQQTSRNGSSTGDSVPPRGLPTRTVVAAIPARVTTQAAGPILNVIYPLHVRPQHSVPMHAAAAQIPNAAGSSGVQPLSTAPPQPSPGSAFSNIVAQISAQVINALGAQGLNSPSQGANTANVQDSSNLSGTASSVNQPLGTQSGMFSHANQSSNGASASSGAVDTQHPSPNIQSTHSESLGEYQQVSPDLSPECMKGDVTDVAVAGSNTTASAVSNNPGFSVSRSEEQELHKNSSGNVVSSLTNSGEGLSACRDGGAASNDASCENISDPARTTHTSHSGQSSGSNRSTPLGLGLGGLQPKRRAKTLKPVMSDKLPHEPPAVNQDRQSIAQGQQLLHSILSSKSNTDGMHMNGPAHAQTSSTGQIKDGPSGLQDNGGQGQLNPAKVVSAILEAPAFNSLLAGVAEQTGIGSSDLRSILDECTQTPVIKNVLNDLAEQAQSGVERSQGGLDFSRMLQQIMPAVSQVLGRSSTSIRSPDGMQLNFPDGTPLNFQAQSDNGRESEHDTLNERNSVVDLQRSVESIEQRRSPRTIFGSMLEIAGGLVSEGNRSDDLVNALTNDEILVNEFMSLLCRDLHQRAQTDS